jgi:putative ubiquitin-RnfH superfamily antitoxin RatB of RatAB toxin-antitoxin module
MAKNSNLIKVEVAYALPEKQYLIQLQVRSDCTLFQAVEQAGISEYFRDVNLATASFGIFGKKITDPQQQLLKEGDRIEIYRPLLMDPKQRRQLKAKKHKKLL